MLAYAVSFLLVSVALSPNNQGIRGYRCASVTLEYLKWAATSLSHPSVSILDYFPIVLAGLINPVFLVAALIPKSILRIVWLGMVPSCWVVFYQWQPRLYPREGHFLWIAGMALVLFSGQLTGRKTASETDTA